MARELHEVARPAHDRSSLWRSGDSDSTPATEVEQALVSKNPHRAEHRVRVHPEHSRQIARRWKPLAWACFAVGDRATDLRSNLIVQPKGLVAVDLARDHDAMHTSFILSPVLSPPRSDLQLPSEAGEMPAPSPEVLFEEARRRQRKRRLGMALASLIALAISWPALWVVRHHHARTTAPGTSAAPVANRPLKLHLVGWGVPSEPYTGRGSCPDGFTVIPIVSAGGARVGSLSECDKEASKLDKTNWGVRKTHAVLLGTYRLSGGSIRTREQRTFVFARDQLHTQGYFTGTIIGGTGRYVNAKGVVSGGGPSAGNRARWTVRLAFR